MKPEDFGPYVEQLRKKQGLGLRELGRRTGMSAGALSAIEKGRSSPTLVTLHKLLRALGTDLAEYFSSSMPRSEQRVFSSKDHRLVGDRNHKCLFLFPKRKNILFEMLEEVISPGRIKPEWETHDFDVGGYILSGGPLRLEVENEGLWDLKKGDSFYIPAGLKHRTQNMGKQSIKFVTVVNPPRY